MLSEPIGPGSYILANCIFASIFFTGPLFLIGGQTLMQGMEPPKIGINEDIDSVDNSSKRS